MTSWLFDDPPLPSPSTTSLKHHLLSHCQGDNMAVSLETLRLFDSLLSSPCEYVLSRLVTPHLETRGYYQAYATDYQINSWSEEEDEREKHRPRDTGGRTAGQRPPSRTMAPSNIHRIVNAWLYLVPDQLRLDEARGSGYDQYVQDATKQVGEMNEMCLAFSWPREATFEERSETSSAGEKGQNSLVESAST